jgi:MFS family permease
VHQRGKRVAFYNLTFLGCTFFMPVLGGFISMRHGWRTQFQIISAFLVPVVVLVVLLVPEHVYNRPAIFNTDLHSEDNLGDLDEQLARVSELPSTGNPSLTAGQVDKPKTFVQELKIYNGRFTDESFFKLLLAPFVLFLYPATLWAFSFQGTFITWV